MRRAAISVVAFVSLVAAASFANASGGGTVMLCLAGHSRSVLSPVLEFESQCLDAEIFDVAGQRIQPAEQARPASLGLEHLFVIAITHDEQEPPSGAHGDEIAGLPGLDEVPEQRRINQVVLTRRHATIGKSKVMF
jgi:hypothetical protein